MVGGGPAGMMASGRAAERGLRVVLLEKNPTLGKKLLITGGGRCNLTNRKPDTRSLLAKYKGAGKFLFSAFAQFGVEETLDFFQKRGVAVKEENDGRMFPVSDRAQSVWDALVSYMKQGGVRVQTNATVVGITVDEKEHAVVVRLKGREEVRAKSCILATGGISHPETGSTGEGFAWLRKLGHTIADNSVALVPVALKDIWVKKLAGVSLEDVKITVFQNGQKQGSRRGKILFTHFGLTGPMVLNMSKEIGEVMEYGNATMELDLFPAFDHGALKQELQSLLADQSNKKIKNLLGKLVPASFAPVLLDLAGVDGETPAHSLRRQERAGLIPLMKAVPLHVGGLLGAGKAVVSSGGVSLEEVDFKTMRSRLAPNLFLAGDILDIDRPSGGYSLQLCWTTGFVAGSHAGS